MPNQPNFPIPENLTPDTICLCLQIPNDPTWRQTFVGLLAQPTYWFNWERDEARSGKVLSAYWTTLFDEIDWSTMSCCCDQPPAIFRYNSDGVYQRSTDGGVTWVNAPEYDYRNTSTIFPPPAALGIVTTKCSNADSAVVILNEDVIQGLDNGASVQALLEFIAAVLIFYLSAGTLATVAIGLFSMAAAIVGFGVASTKAAFTSGVLTQLRCTIYNNMATNDSIDAAGLAAILADINTNYFGIVRTSLYAIISAAGVVGITNMIRSNRGEAAADCSGCDPCSCDVPFTFFGVTDVVMISDCHYTMTRDTSLGHFAFTSGDISMGCYYNWTGLGAYSSWGVGSAGPNGVNPKTSPIWNFDTAVGTTGDALDVVFSGAPFP
jgi:hypothetical protein